MATVDLTVAADLSALRKQLAEIPGLTADAATQMTRDLKRALDASTKASKSAADAAKKAAEGAKTAAKEAADGLDQLNDKAGTLGSSAGKLAGVLDLLVPGLGNVARTTADLADAGEVAATAGKGLGVSLSSLLGVLGPVAVAVAAATAAFALLNSVQEEYDRRNEAAAAKATQYQAAAEQFNAIQEKVGESFALASGKITSYDVKLKAVNKEVDNASASMLALAQATYDQAEADAEAEAWFNESANKKAYRAKEDLDKIKEKIQTLKDQNEFVVLSEKMALDAAKAEADAAKEAAKNAAARAKDEADAAAAREKALAQTQTYRDLLTTLQGTARDAADSQLEGEAAILAALERKVEALNAEAAARVETAGLTSEQIVAIEAARLDAVTALEDEAQAKIDDLKATAHQQRLDEIAAEQAAQVQAAQATQAATASLLGSIGDLAGLAGDQQVAASKEAALTLFAVQKAAALAQATINAALAVSQGLATGGPIAAVAAGVAGAVQIATIAATPPPTFADTPAVMQMGNRGNVQLAAGDYFAAAKSPSELARQTGGGSTSILEVRLGHRVLDRSVAQTIRQGGRLSRELASTRSGSVSHGSRS